MTVSKQVVTTYTYKCSHLGCEAKTEKPATDGWYEMKCASGDFDLVCPAHRHDRAPEYMVKIKPDDDCYVRNSRWMRDRKRRGVLVLPPIEVER